jgi:hypothetical protein
MDTPYCITGCGRPAVGESTIGIMMEPVDEDGFIEVVELKCDVCLS